MRSDFTLNRQTDGKFEATLRRKEADLIRRICGAHGGYETAEMRDVRRFDGGRGLRKKSGCGVSPTTSERSASSAPTSSGRLQPRTRRNGARRRNKGRNVSWRNGSLQRKSQGWTMTCISSSNRSTVVVVCPNATGRTKERIVIAQSKRASSSACSLALIVD